MRVSREITENADMAAPSFLLVLALALGGLRSSAAWAVFTALFLAWFLMSRRPFAPTSALPALFFSWLAAASFFSPDLAASLPVLCKYAVLGLFFFSASSAPCGRENWLRAVLGLGALAASVFIFQKLSGRPVLGLVGANPNYSAVFAAAAFPAAVIILSGAEGVRGISVYSVLVLLLAAGMVVSGSRGALLAACLSAGAGLAVLGKRRALAALILALLAVAALSPVSTLEGVFKFSAARAFERPRLWGAALEAAAARPFFGWGPGLFERAFEIVKFPYFDGISYYGHYTMHAHSEPLNLAAEAGFPAAVFFVLAAAAGLLGGGRRGLPLKLAALAVFIEAGTDMIFYSGASALLFWGCLGFSGYAGEAPAARPKLKWLAAGSLCALWLAAGLASGAAVRGGSFLQLGYSEALAGRNPELALAALDYSGRHEPKDPFLAEAAGRVLAASGRSAEAEASFRRALALEPFYAGARLDLAHLRADAGLRGECSAMIRAMPLPSVSGARNSYQRALLERGGVSIERLEKDICWKKKTGGATAPGPRTR